MPNLDPLSPPLAAASHTHPFSYCKGSQVSVYPGSVAIWTTSRGSQSGQFHYMPWNFQSEIRVCLGVLVRRPKCYGYLDVVTWTDSTLRLTAVNYRCYEPVDSKSLHKHGIELLALTHGSTGAPKPLSARLNPCNSQPNRGAYIHRHRDVKKAMQSLGPS